MASRGLVAERIMLTVNNRRFNLVRGSSGLHATLGLEEYFAGHQHWRLNLIYVPADDDAGTKYDLPECWRLSINPLSLKIADWREDLGSLRVGLDSGNEFFLAMASFTNIVDRSYSTPASFDLEPGSLRVVRRNGLFFTMELDGEIVAAKSDEGDEQKNADAAEMNVAGEFRLLDEAPLTGVDVHVPVNAKDAVAYARKIAARELKLDAFSDKARVSPYNPDSTWPRRIGRGTHTVHLATHWRGAGHVA